MVISWDDKFTPLGYLSHACLCQYPTVGLHSWDCCHLTQKCVSYHCESKSSVKGVYHNQ